MTIDVYKNSSPNNYINKSIALVDNLECFIKEDCDIVNPTIEVYGTNALNANYMWIPLFSRYYFIKRVTTQNIDTLLVEGHVDVLMSFQSALLNASGIIARNENVWNGYLNDKYMRQFSYKRLQTKTFSTKLSDTVKYYLIASGGAV